MSQIKFTEAQLKVISHAEGPLLVTAGPGSGKTTVLTHRLVTMIRDHKIDPEKILVITLTRAAANEMRQRFFALMEDESLPIVITTFHAAFLGLLCQEHIKGRILTEEEAIEWVHAYLTEEEGMSDTEALFLRERILHGISAYRNLGHWKCADEDIELYDRAFRYYENEKHLNERIDFDDLLILMLEKLNTDARFCASARARFSYVLVDEAQDCNGIQYEIVHRICAESRNMMLVGDDDQSIYGFRGSSPEYMLRFARDFPEMSRIDLTVNFRSRPRIVEASRRLISNNVDRFQKDLSAAHPGRAEIRKESFPNARRQAGFLCKEIRSWHKLIPYDEMAVLCRTRRQYDILERAFRTARIPYLAEKEVSFGSDMEEDIKAYLDLAIHPEHAGSLYRIWNRPQRGIKEAYRVSQTDRSAVTEVLRHHPQDQDLKLALEELVYHLNRLRGMAPSKAIRYIWYRMGYRAYRRDLQEQEWMPWNVVRRSFRMILEEAGCYQDIAAYLSRTSAHLEDAVHLMTIHGAKGLEFDAVWIPDLNEGTLPFEKSLHDIEEERRIFYVALTRARRFVSLLYLRSKKAGCLPSRFLRELE